jgi:malate dehydrogenase (oxaloacetate-decarboxylating)(NADP+)
MKMICDRTGRDYLIDAAATKSTAFTREERDSMRLRGLLPHAVATMDTQVDRVLENMRRKSCDIEKYVFLTALQDRNERLYYRLVSEHIEEIMPLIYTPTVGQACREFAHIFRRPRGFYVTPDDRGSIRAILDNWPEDDVKVIVVTDGERILGLGDLGANGMGIPIGKLALYTACAGIHPSQCLPVMLDVGTNNQALRNDPLYLGYPHERIEGDEYLSLVDEFIEAARDRYPDVLIQFEDFLTPNAYGLLNRYRNDILCFNDDIQGTAAVALAGVYAASRATGKPLRDMRIMFLGAGSAATGIGDLLCEAMKAEGVSDMLARQQLWFVDKDGLVVASRDDLMEHNLPYAHKFAPMDFLMALDAIHPDVLIGATGAPGTFTKEVIRKMSSFNDQPVIFALSNPTSKAECTADQAYDWSEGRALFSSGSPFAPVCRNGRIHKPGQGNNAYIFPGIGLGAIAARASRLPEDVFLVAARTLADMVSDADLADGALYPPLTNIREVSRQIAINVAECALSLGISNMSDEEAADIPARVSSLMYEPYY